MTARAWPTAPAGSLFAIELGKMASPRARGGADPLPYVANRNVQWHHVAVGDLPRMAFSPAERERFRLRPGDVLVCEGGDVGRTALWRGELPVCFYQKAIHRLRPRGDDIDPAFMVWFMRACADRGELARLAARTSIPHLTVPRLSALAVPVPPLADQRRIVAALDAARDAVRAARAVAGKLARIEAALVGDVVARAAAGGPVRDPDGTSRPRVIALGQVLAGPPRAGYSPAPSPRPTGLYALGLACLTPLGFRPVQLKHAPAGDPRAAGALARDGDVLVSRANTRALVGQAGIYRDIGAPCIFPDLMMRLVPTDAVAADYLALALRGADCRAQIQARAHGTSDTMVKLTAAGLAQIRVPVPDLADQRRVVAACAAATARREREEAHARKLEHIERGLVAALFAPAL